MRGKRRHPQYRICAVRITPAGAGKTLLLLLCSLLFQDHPRRCGENGDLHLWNNGFRGSPPQVRGKRKNPLAVYSRYRITPAGAGKTYSKIC